MLIKLSDTKAYSIQAIKMEDGSKFLSVRQMYAKKSAPEEWLPGRQGLTLPWGKEAMQVLRAGADLIKDPEVKFKKIKRDSK